MREYDHPLRNVLHEEVHARPPVALWPRDRVFSQAFLIDDATRQAQLHWINQLSEALKINIDPHHGQSFRILEIEPSPQRIILKWELHGEFASISVMVQQESLLSETHIQSRQRVLQRVAACFQELGLQAPEMSGGLRIAALDIAFEDRGLVADAIEIAPLFNNNTLLGSHILTSQRAQLWTDLQINDDGYISYLVPNLGIGSRQAGRIARRIIEVETYRMAAMIAFPLAKSLSLPLKQAEKELSQISKDIASLHQEQGIQTERDGQFLATLSALASRTEQWISDHGLRFTAADAYSQLVEKNLQELNESPVPGVQTLSEFMDRRFQPAMSTCSWTQKRLRDLSDRIARTTQTLRTRIEYVNEEQTQKLLMSMDQRAKLQLRLQETVEGLSVLVLTYYAVSLFIYMLKGLKAGGYDVSPELAGGIAAPVVALLFFLINRLRRSKTARPQ